MSLVLIEGLDRTGKSTVAKYFESLGYEYIHLSAPPKELPADLYLQEMVELISAGSTKDIVLDRTHYGELIWPSIYNREAKLSEEDIESLREIENACGVQRILMTDLDSEAHWKRCVENKEPLNKAQFSRARSLYSQMAHKYQFELISLPQFLKQYPDAEQFNVITKTTLVQGSGDQITNTEVELPAQPISSTAAKYPSGKTQEQLKLEKANVINDILTKRILKSKGPMYDELENELRAFLNSKLGKLLGGTSQELTLSSDEIRFYKAMFKRATEKGDN